MSRTLRLIGLIMLVGSLGACATVRPWERELLSHPAMDESVDPSGSAFDGHWEAAREAALGAGSSGGGGCGCN